MHCAIAYCTQPTNLRNPEFLQTRRDIPDSGPAIRDHEAVCRGGHYEGDGDGDGDGVSAV